MIEDIFDDFLDSIITFFTELLAGWATGLINNSLQLFQSSGVYYGLNALSRNMIMGDRKRLKNPNGLFLGTPGSGKSMSVKREITDVYLRTKKG